MMSVCESSEIYNFEKMTIHEKETEVKREPSRRFLYSWSSAILRDVRFTKETRRVKRGMATPYPRCLLAWSAHTSYPSPDFLVKALSSSDQDVELRHSWTRAEGEIAWSGTVAVYKNWSKLEQAAGHVVRNLKDIRVLWFPDMVNLLIAAERSRPQFGEGCSRVVVRGRRSLDRGEAREFQRLLREFGEVKSMKMRRGKTKFDAIAEVDYRFATHAFVAKFQLNGMAMADIGYLRAEVEETEREREIREEVTARLFERFETSG